MTRLVGRRHMFEERQRGRRRKSLAWRQAEQAESRDLGRGVVDVAIKGEKKIVSLGIIVRGAVERQEVAIGFSC